MKRTSTFLIGIILLVTVMFAGHANAQDCVEAPAGLVSWWPGDGNADDIVSGFDGTLVNGATFAPGFVGDAFSFDGVGGGRNDRVNRPRRQAPEFTGASGPYRRSLTPPAERS